MFAARFCRKSDVYLGFLGGKYLIYSNLLNVDFPCRSEETKAGPEKGVQILSRVKLEMTEACNLGTFFGLPLLLRPFMKVASMLV